MKKVLLFAVVFSCSMWANAQRVTWATEAGLSAIQRTGYGECWRPSTRLGISADYNVNNVFSMKSGLYYTLIYVPTAKIDKKLERATKKTEE